MQFLHIKSFILVFLLQASVLSQPAWKWQNPYPQGTDINAIVFLDSLHGYTAGVLGTINRTTDGGTNWTQCLTGSIQDFFGLSFSDINNGTAVGVGGTILHTTNTGLTWVKQSSGTNNTLKGVSFSSHNIGTAVGLYGTILRTTNGGLTWSPQLSGTSAHLYDISCPDALHGTAVGQNGIILQTTNGGSLWILQSSGTTQNLNTVKFLDENVGMAAGSNGTILRTTDGGISWNIQTTGTNGHIYCMSFTDSNNGMVAGISGLIMSTTNGGLTWITQSSGTTDHLYGISTFRISLGWVVGRSGTLINSSDGGVSWMSQRRGTLSNLHGLSFSDSLTGTAVGDNGTVVRTTDGGIIWNMQFSGTSSNLEKVKFLDNQRGVIIGDGGTILQTTDGGMSWTNRSIGFFGRLFGISFPDPDTGYISAQNGTILRTTDAGESWSIRLWFGIEFPLYNIFMDDVDTGIAVSFRFHARTTTGFDVLRDEYGGIASNALRDVFLFDGQTGTVVGDGGIIFHTSDLMTSSTFVDWESQNSGTTYSLRGINFIDSQTGTIVGDFGTILQTTNRGINWYSEESGTANNLHDIDCRDDTHCWIVGDKGTILFKDQDTVEDVKDIVVTEKWNILSIPFKVDDYTKVNLFPTAVSSAFAFENGYVSYDTLENGRGYWLKFPQAQTVVMEGTPLDAETVDVDADWNMVGSLSSPLAVSTISSIPGGIVTSGFYQFDGSYQQSTVILPGKGYWVKCFQAGQLVFSSAGNTPTAARIRIEDKGEMPPPPPDEHQPRETSVPLSYSLSQNTPNPFNPFTEITFSLPTPGLVTLRIFDILGREVSTLIRERKEVGTHTVEWKAGSFPSGIYFYRLSAGEYSETKKMVLLK